MYTTNEVLKLFLPFLVSGSRSSRTLSHLLPFFVGTAVVVVVVEDTSCKGTNAALASLLALEKIGVRLLDFSHEII